MTQIAFQYEPRHQFLPFHSRKERFSTLVCHRRAGKTVACINDILARASYTKKKSARYAYIAPFYRQAKDVAWEYLKEFGGGAITKIRKSELRVELFNGAWITLYGADNPDALRGLYFDGVILDEYGDCRPSLWQEVIFPTLIDRKGWAVFIGTPKGKNHFWEVWEQATDSDDWFDMMLKASESGIISAADLEQARRMQDDASYMQEFECSFEASVKGSYYTDIMNEIVETAMLENMYDPELLVNVASDLGKSDSTAFWFWQDTPDGPVLIDYYENDGKDLDHYFALLDSKPYSYDTIWLPHDAVAQTLATKRSTIEQFIDWADNRFKIRKVPKLARQHGIDAGRMVMRVVRFDKSKCYKGINALRHYRRKYNEVLKAYSEQPQHDWSSNGADAYRYFALVVGQDAVERDIDKTYTPLVKPPEYQLATLWEQYDSERNRARTIRI